MDGIIKTQNRAEEEEINEGILSEMRWVAFLVLLMPHHCK